MMPFFSFIILFFLLAPYTLAASSSRRSGKRGSLIKKSFEKSKAINKYTTLETGLENLDIESFSVKFDSNLHFDDCTCSNCSSHNNVPTLSVLKHSSSIKVDESWMILLPNGVLINDDLDCEDENLLDLITYNNTIRNRYIKKNRTFAEYILDKMSNIFIG